MHRSCIQREHPAWKLTAPKEGEDSTKEVNGKTYHWCTGNGAHKPMWVMHLPAECRGLKDDKKPKADDKKPKAAEPKESGGTLSGGGNGTGVRWTAAMAELAKLNTDSDSDDE